MGFGRQNKTVATQQRNDKGYRTVGAMWKSKKFDGYNIMVDRSNKNYKAKGQLIYRDLNTGELFKIKSISCYDPKKPVNGLVFNLVVNLNNDFQVEPLTDSDVSSESPDPGTGSQEFEPVEEYPNETQSYDDDSE